jgi:Tol biopolymer transport system component
VDSEAPTVSDLTEPGVVLGTVGYMSPEQVSGKAADHRADIFAFGTILYEMLTGKRAFQKPTSAETMSAILNEDPPDISHLMPAIPHALQRVVHRCLQKSPGQRFQSASDLAFALEALSDSSSATAAAVARPASRRAWLLWAAAALVLLIAVLTVGIWWFKRPPGTALPPSLTQLTWDSGLTADPALSPDGKMLAYASDRSGEGHLDIYAKQVGGGEPLRLTSGPGDKREPTFSPDGTTIAFRSEQDEGIYLVSTLGGSARRFASEGYRPKFSADGKWIAYSSVGDVGGPVLNIGGEARIYVAPSTGGAPRQIQPGFVGAAYPTWSPDSEHLMFLGYPDKNEPLQETLDWWVTPLTGGPAIKTGALDAARGAKLSGDFQIYPWVTGTPAWQPDGKGLIFSARSGDTENLWRIAISPTTFKVNGLPQRLTSGPTREESPSVVLGTGGGLRVAFESTSENTSVYGLSINPNEGKVLGGLQRLTHDVSGSTEPSLSHDGNKVTFVSLRPGNQDVWIEDLRTGQESALTSDGAIKYSPIFSPDGSRVSFAESPSWNVYIVPSKGGVAEMVCGGCGEVTSWSPDGKYIIGNGTKGNAWALDVVSRHKSDLLATSRWIATATFSPDGQWFSFMEVTQQGLRSYVARLRDAPIPESAWITTIDGAMAWSPDGNVLYATSYRDGHNCIWAQRIDPETKRPVGAPFAVFHSHNARLSLATATEFWMTVADSRIVFSMGERTGNIWMAEWKEQ